MISTSAYKKRLAKVFKLWELEDYDAAIADVEDLQQTAPGNANLQILWASLIQLQEDPQRSLDEAKEALQKAYALDDGSPVAAVELAQFLDNVEDDPRAAARYYAETVSSARKLLIEGLIGHAKVCRQLGKWQEFRSALVEAIHLAHFEAGSSQEGELAEMYHWLLDMWLAREKAAKKANGDARRFEMLKNALPAQGHYTEEIQDLLSEVGGD